MYDKIFVRCNPAFLQDLSQTVLLSVAAAVTASMATNPVKRLDWLEIIFSCVDPLVSSLIASPFPALGMLRESFPTIVGLKC